MSPIVDPRQRPLPLEPAQDRTHYNLDRSTLESGHEDAWAESLHRRYSEPPAYTALRVISELSRAPTYASRPPDDSHPPQSPGVAAPSSPVISTMHPELTCEHRYILKSRGKDWAALYVSSRAHSAQDRPLLYAGDDVSGRVSIALGKLGEIQRIEVVLQEFKTGQVTPAAETRKTMLPSDVDASLVRAGVVEWGFALMPALLGSSPLRTAFPVAQQGPLDGRCSCQLLVTVYRRGRLSQNAALRQQIEYLGPSSSNLSIDDLTPSSPVHEAPARPQHRPWVPQADFPELRISGNLFSERGGGNVDIFVQLAVPARYPSCASIPLRLALACADRRALDLLHSRPDGLDVCMYKVVAHGAAAARLGPLSLTHRSEFFRQVPVARGRFRASDVLSDESDATIWRLNVEGELVALSGVGEVGPTLRFPDLVVMYTVVVYPFKVAGFRPTLAPDKKLFIAEIPLLPERLAS
ncbi:hypothetical protein PENSPDRAFT_757624 [Peniophora sp. CONT]|nr:hypothetical protein PENSPDRAFT_757624 [Peniophora sp. CONT]